MKAERKLELVPLTTGLYLIGGKVHEAVISVNPVNLISQVPYRFYCIPFDNFENARILTGYAEYKQHGAIGPQLLEAMMDMRQTRIGHMYIRRQTPFVELAKEINSFITETQQPVLIPNFTVGGEEVKMVCRVRRVVNKEGYDSARLEAIFVTPTSYMCFDRSMKKLDEFFNKKRDDPSKYLMISDGPNWENVRTRYDFEKEYLARVLSDHDPEQVYDQVSSYSTVERDELLYVRNYVLEMCTIESEKVCNAVKLVTADVEPRERVNQVIITEIFG